jgi:ABC-type sugar transport system ATPase subunit
MKQIDTQADFPAAAAPAGAHAARGLTPDPDRMLLKMDNVCKAFGGVQALSNVGLELESGTVHAIVGHNGAGKSTLMKVLSGVIAPDSGSLLMNGRQIVLKEPRHAQEHGISMVHQELSVLEDLDIAENIFLGREPLTRAGLTDRGRLDQAAQELLDRLGLHLPVRALCSSLSIGERQMVEIARAVSWQARVVILDEPTSALSEREEQVLFELIARLKASGIGILYISHRLDEILLLADTVTVMREGRNVGRLKRGEFDHSTLVERMLGHPVQKVAPPAPSNGARVLDIRDLHSRSGKLKALDLSVSAGEIVGIAGMLGSGRSELFECLFGIRQFESGELRLKGRSIHPKSPRDAMLMGIALVPEDRKVQGIFPGTSLWKNVTLASVHDLFSRLGIVTVRQARKVTLEQVERLGIRAHSIGQDISLLSGGNQQKAIIARWILRNPDILLLDEPSAGIDIGAKAEIHELIRDLARQGVAIVVSSSEFDELIGLCHRIVIMRDGTIINEVDGAAATEHSLVLWATGGHHE